jgi:hypothetical protein
VANAHSHWKFFASFFQKKALSDFLGTAAATSNL